MGGDDVSYNITVEGGTSVRLTTAGKYCDRDIVVTATGGGGGDELAALLSNTLTELNNSATTALRTRACQQATKLVSVNLPNVTTIGTYAFYNCSGLVSAKLPKLESVSSQSFYSCTKLQYCDIGQSASIAAQAFNACAALKTLIIRKTGSICTLVNTSAIKNSGIGSGNGYIYVPAALVSEYKAGENWSTFADCFRAIEDYPEICG